MHNQFSVEGKVALVTGTSRASGAHCARVLHDQGASVVGLSRSLGEFADLSSGQSAQFISVDLTEEHDWFAVVEAISVEFGAPDILINAAGVNPRKHADETSSSDWAMTVALNLTAPFFLAQALVPRCEQRDLVGLLILRLCKVNEPLQMDWHTVRPKRRCSDGSCCSRSFGHHKE